MRKAFVFIATFVAVLIAGAAFAFMAAPDGDAAGSDKEQAVEEPTTTSLFHEEEKEPPAEPEKEPEDPQKEEPRYDGPGEEEKDEPEEDTTPPELVILYPENGAHFTESHLAFEGEAEPGSEVYAGEYKADIDDSGHWRIVLILSPGGNLTTFRAYDDAGNVSEAQVKAYLDLEKEESKEEPRDHDFTAHQKYGSCGEDLPYDKWYGTGEPGTKIWIGSDYGSNSTVIGEDGSWFVKVLFPEAPCNSEFKVVLETDGGHRQVYEFIRWCEGDGGDHEGDTK